MTVFRVNLPPVSRKEFPIFDLDPTAHLHHRDYIAEIPALQKYRYSIILHRHQDVQRTISYVPDAYRENSASPGALTFAVAPSGTVKRHIHLSPS